MPSRALRPLQRPEPPLTAPAPHHHTTIPLPTIGGGAAAAAASVFLFLLTLFRKITRNRTAPSDSKPPHRFSYSVLRRATASFSEAHRLGQGGFGSVYRGVLPSTHQPVAVKVMDSGSLQGEREFQNELFFASKLDSPFIASVLGFSSDRKRRRMLLVYELMPNGNLQDALLHRKCEELLQWQKRFSVAVDIAKGLEYLHSLDPPVIHGDIKPSNILLDRDFSAKIGDFGLARLKSDSQCEVTVPEGDAGKLNGGLEGKKEELDGNGGAGLEDNGSVVEETESIATTTVFEDSIAGVLDHSPEGFARAPYSMTSPEAVEASVTSPEGGVGAASASEGNLERDFLENEKELVDGRHNKGKGVKNASGKDWWWKQDSSMAESGVVKDYVMEWIGKEIKKERPNRNWIGTTSSSGNTEKTEKKKNRRRLEWWISLDDETTRQNWKKDKRRPIREWWKDEYCEELDRKKKKKKKKMGFYSDDNCGEDWWERDEDLYSEKKKKSRGRSRSSKSSVDWWLDGLSGELWRARRNSYDSMSGEIPKSGGICSTPSMRGTVCYVAPEYGGAGDLSEKCDVYSFGVLLLVIVAGRRPLQVSGSAMGEFQRANLISWARHLARRGKLLDLVDKSVVSLDCEQALLCITIALHCLQKLPVRRPSMKEVVAILTGEMEPPHLPLELSPSPPSCFRYKSQKKIR